MRLVYTKVDLPEGLRSELIDLFKGSLDGELRTLAGMILAEWQDRSLIPLFKAALEDPYKISHPTDVISPTGTYRGPDGQYYRDRYPVREQAFSALLKLGVRVKRQANSFLLEEDYVTD